MRFVSDLNGIKITYNGNDYTYFGSNIKQYGTTALILRGTHSDEFILALNEDCVVDSVSGIIENGGTVSLCKIGEDASPVTMFCETAKSDYLEQFNIPGMRLMDYLSFRSGVALILSIFIATVIGRRIIDRLQMMQVGEIVRNLGLEGQMSKKGTPTMGGVIIIISIIIPCLLVGNLTNIYMLLMIVSTLLFGMLGFLDDYKKLKFHNKDGLSGKYKIVGQVGVGLIVGLTMYLSPDIVVRQNIETQNITSHEIEVTYNTVDEKLPITTIPFVKSNNLDYTWFTKWMGDNAETGGWILFILF